MISKTVEEGLLAYHIGDKIRALRLRKKMGLVELGQHTGLSPALLSKIERSRLFPPLGTLLRIAMVFGVGLDFFFDDDEKRHVVAVVRAKERQRFPDNPGKGHVSYFFESLDYPATERRLSGFLADFQPSEEEPPPHQHEGVELLFVLTGKLSLTIGLAEYELDTGDSIYFDCTVPHSYRRLGAKPCRAVVVTTA